MKVISVRQPWAWLIVHGGKDIENRRWNSHYRGPLLIHAPAGMTSQEYNHAVEWLTERQLPITLPEPSSLVRSAILGECTVVNWVSSSTSPWFVGPYGALLHDHRAYAKTIPCKGKLGLWDVSDEILPLLFIQRSLLA